MSYAGDVLKRKMIKNKMTLRMLMNETGFDPSNLSKYERGKLLIPLDAYFIKRLVNGLKMNNAEVDEFTSAVIFDHTRKLLNKIKIFDERIKYIVKGE
jgi:hypothetical protein